MLRFEDESLEIQRELYHSYKELKMKLPPKYEQLSNMEDNLENDKFAFFRETKEKEEFDWTDEEDKAFE